MEHSLPFRPRYAHSLFSTYGMIVRYICRTLVIVNILCFNCYCPLRVCYGQEKHAKEVYSHLLVERLVQGVEGHLISEACYLKLPRSEISDSEPGLTTPSDPRARVLAVTRQAVYFSIRGKNIERVSLRDDTGRTFFPVPDDRDSELAFSPLESHFYIAPTAQNLVYGFDVADQSRELVVDRSEAFSGLRGATHNADMAVSPDGKLLATATFTRGQLYPKYAIEIFEISAHSAPKLKFSKVLPGELLSTGAGFPTVAPAMTWDRPNGLLLLVPEAVDWQKQTDDSADEQEQRVRVLDVQPDRPTHSVLQLSVDDQAITKVLELHLGETLGDFYGPAFWKTPNQKLMLECQFGRWELDIKARTAIQSRMLSPDYGFKGDARFPSLWYRDRELAAKVNPAFVSLSPDGQQVAWCEPVNPQQVLSFQSLQFEQILKHHSAETGSTPVMEGRLSDGSHSLRVSCPNSRGWLHWVSSF